MREKMTGTAVFEHIAGRVYRLSIPFGNCPTASVLINDPEKPVIIDSGGNAGSVDDYIVPALAEMDIDINTSPLLLVSTHTHGDHVGGHARLKELCPHLTVGCYKKQTDKIRDPLKYSKMIRDAFPEFSPAPPKELRGVEPDVILGTYDEIAPDVYLIPAPGHDDDCCAFYDSDTGTMITGDSVQGGGTNVQGTALFTDASAYLDTIGNLSDFNPEHLVASHPFVPEGDIINGVNRIKSYLRYCAENVYRYKGIAEGCAFRGLDSQQTAMAIINAEGNPIPDYLFLPLHTLNALNNFEIVLN